MKALWYLRKTIWKKSNKEGVEAKRPTTYLFLVTRNILYRNYCCGNRDSCSKGSNLIRHMDL